MWEEKVGQSRLSDTWISLQDFIKGSSCQERDFQPDVVAPIPSRSVPTSEWMDASDYFLNGIRVDQPLPDESQFIVTLREPPPPPPAPPEAGMTIYDAMRQIYSVYGPKNAIFSRLRQMEQQDRQELNDGRIDLEEFERRAVATAIIRENHGRRMEKITKWYLDNYFRLFENPEPVVVPDETTH
ncbi:MAG: hypothetical protein HQL73_11380 [Magnetococcales bacterium]|nr:hypothetical protein [Magnetococcales bacterium]